MVYDRVNGRLVVHVDDERTVRVLSRHDGDWIVRSLGARFETADGPRVRSVAGLPAGVDAQGNVYLARGGYINVLRQRGTSTKQPKH